MGNKSKAKGLCSHAQPSIKTMNMKREGERRAAPFSLPKVFVIKSVGL